MTEGGQGLDLDDPAVREMAERNHQPQELWWNTGELHLVTCETCGHRWPCPTARRLRAEDAS